MTKFDFSSKPTVQEMQTWNKRYKLGEDTTRVIDTFDDDGEFWTIHPNEAYNLCITLNEQHETINHLSKVVEARKNLIDGCDNENNELKKQRYDLYMDIARLVKENEQLKADKQSLIDFIKKEFPKSHKHILEELND